jgi:hypothetical protein
MNCGGSKKMGYMDLGGNFVDMSSVYKSAEPMSGMASMSESDKPKKPKGYNYKAHQARGQKAFKNRGKCGRKGC